MSDNAIHTFDKLAEGSKFVFAVGMEQPHSLHLTANKLTTIVYRGHWCPFCMSYLQSFAALAPAIRSLGGAPVIITAESEKYLEKTRGATQWDGLSIIDANLELVDEMRKRGWVDVKLTKTTKDGYAKGQMAQPAVLVLRHGGEVLESWAVIPSLVSVH